MLYPREDKESRNLLYAVSVFFKQNIFMVYM